MVPRCHAPRDACTHAAHMCMSVSQVEADEFVVLVSELDGRTERGMRAMRAAAEKIAKTAEEAKTKAAVEEAKTKAVVEVRASELAELQAKLAKVQEEAAAKGNEANRAPILLFLQDILGACRRQMPERPPDEPSIRIRSWDAVAASPHACHAGCPVDPNQPRTRPREPSTRSTCRIHCGR